MSRLKEGKEESAFGYHLMLDCYDCNAETIDSVEACYNYLNELVDVIGTKRQAPPFVMYTDPIEYPDKAGISGWIPIVESGFSIHTITPVKFISVDIYSCRRYDRETIKEFTQRTFTPGLIEEKFVLRGEGYGELQK